MQFMKWPLNTLESTICTLKIRAPRRDFHIAALCWNQPDYPEAIPDRAHQSENDKEYKTYPHSALVVGLFSYTVVVSYVRLGSEPFAKSPPAEIDGRSKCRAKQQRKY